MLIIIISFHTSLIQFIILKLSTVKCYNKHGELEFNICYHQL